MFLDLGGRAVIAICASSSHGKCFPKFTNWWDVSVWSRATYGSRTALASLTVRKLERRLASSSSRCHCVRRKQTAQLEPIHDSLDVARWKTYRIVLIGF